MRASRRCGLSAKSDTLRHPSIAAGMEPEDPTLREDTMKDLFGMMKQVQQMQERAQRLQEDLAAMEVGGEAGGGLVRVTLNGKGDMKGIKIDPSLMKPEETEIVEDLVIAATSDAKAKVEAQMKDKMQELTGGLPLPPGLKLF